VRCMLGGNKGVHGGNQARTTAWLGCQGNHCTGIPHCLCPAEHNAQRGAISPHGAQWVHLGVVGQDGLEEELAHAELFVEGCKGAGADCSLKPANNAGLLVNRVEEGEGGWRLESCPGGVQAGMLNAGDDVFEAQGHWPRESVSNTVCVQTGNVVTNH
jgi:hypothetical protein